MERNFNMYIMISILMLLFCGPKPFQWEGQHIKINTTEQPKEDFMIGDYVVIAYAPCEYKKGISRLYKFALIQEGKQVGLITLDKHEFIFTAYYLEESGFNRGRPIYSISSSGNHKTYYIYKDKPGYARVKADIITLLMGGELVPEPLEE